MAKGNNLQDLSQIDYCLQQYYSKYMAATLLQERKKILQEQKSAAKNLMNLFRDCLTLVPLQIRSPS